MLTYDLPGAFVPALFMLSFLHLLSMYLLLLLFCVFVSLFHIVGCVALFWFGFWKV